jgi:hypothetical protein
MAEEIGASFSITNSSVTASAINSAHAQVTSYVGSVPTPPATLAELHARIVELSQQIGRTDDIADRDQLAGAADTLADEVGAAQPDQYRVLGLLTRLGTGVKGVATLATAVASIAAAVGPLLGIG